MIQPSIWELESFFAPKDVIIVGSGLAGLWSAYYLKKLNPEWQILVVDKGIIPSGASTRNAGFACFGSATELLEDAKMMGKEKMLELVATRFEGLQRIKKTFKKREISFEQNGGYELITWQQYSTRKQLKKDIDWLNNCLFRVVKNKEVFTLADQKIKEFGFQQTAYLIKNRLEGQLHSGKLVQCLMQKVQAMGVMVINNTEVGSFEAIPGKISLKTTSLLTLVTKKLLICTNAFAMQLLPGSEIVPARGQVLVTSPIKSLPFKGTFHYDEGFYYFRNLGKRILLGGARNKAFADEQTMELTPSDTIQNALEKFLKEVIAPGKAYTIDHRWSGIMGMGTSKFPTVKQFKQNCYCAVGLGGMGVSLAPMVGEKVAIMMS